MTLYVVGRTHGMFGAPELFDAEIVRETARFYYVARDANTPTDIAFRWRERVPKSEADLTPRLAWERFFAASRLAAAAATRDLEAARMDVDAAAKALFAFVAESHPRASSWTTCARRSEGC